MRVLKIAGWTMIGSGCLILLFLVYQLAVTDLLNNRAQSVAANALDSRFEALREKQPTEVVVVPTLPGETQETPKRLRTRPR